MINSKTKSKAKKLKETQASLKKIESKLKHRLNSTTEAMAEAKQISASLDKLERKNK